MTPETLKADGWRQLRAAGFSQVAGGLWARGEGADLRVGFIAGEPHGNGHMGTVHGGMLMTFADVALGYAAIKTVGGLSCVTAQLQVQFIHPAQVGEFVQCRPEILRRSAHLIFLRGLITAGERTVASTDGIWKIVKPTANPLNAI